MKKDKGDTHTGEDQGEDVAEPVSEFLRFLIAEWEAEGKLLYVLADQAGLAKSMPSQIKAGTSNASFYSASRLAAPLGYRDLPSLVTAAYAWWKSDRKARPERRGVGGKSAARLSLEAAAAELGYTADEVDTAAMVAAMVRGDAELSREKAEELLSRARLFIRDGARSVAESGSAPATTRTRRLRSGYPKSG